MRDNLLDMNQRGAAEVPVLLGGAALTRTYVERDLREVYEGRLFYGKDAFEGLHTMDRLMELKRGPGGFERRPRLRPSPGRPGAAPAIDGAIGGGRRRSCRPARPRWSWTTRSSCPPSWVRGWKKGCPSTTSPSTSTRPPCSATNGAIGPTGGETDAEFKDAGPGRLAGGTGRGPAPGRAAAGGGLRVLPGQRRRRRTGHLEGRVPHRRSGCGSASPASSVAAVAVHQPTSSGPSTPASADYAAFCVVTMGGAVSEATASLFAENRYTEYLHLHGLGVEMAEALAEYWHRRIREEWGFAGEDGPSLAGLFRQQYRGGRYSWGYPACPTSRTTPSAPNWSGPTASAWRSTRSRLAVPPRADHRGHHLPPPSGQVLRHLPGLGEGAGARFRCRGGAFRLPGRRRRPCHRGRRLREGR